MTGEWTFNAPRIFCRFLRSVHFGSGANQASNLMENGFSPAENWSRHEDENHIHLESRLKQVELYLHSSMRFHDVVFTCVKILSILNRKK